MERVGETFREEAVELLGELEAALLELEASPRDRGAVGRVFRALHTLKGSGGMSGFHDIASFTHEVETVYEQVREGRLDVTTELISLTLSARDEISALLKTSVNSGLSAKVEELARRFRGLAGESESVPQREGLADAPASPEGERTYRIRFRPHSGMFLQGINPLGLFRELERLGELRLEVDGGAVPTLEEIEPEKCYLAWEGLLTTSSGIDAVRDVFIFVEDDCHLSIEPAKEAKVAGAEKGSKPSLSAGSEKALPSEGESSATVRVRSDKLDALVDLIGELVTVQARLLAIAGTWIDSSLDSVSEEVERLTWELRDQVLNIRMLPIGTTFSRFGRLVRDLGIELGKNVVLTTEGAETELDKTVIERLSDPLVHLIRNCIDHGIETPRIREKAAKPPKGRIHLAARHSGAHVILEVSDDGKGIDLEVIRERAAALGLIALDADLSERELLACIFDPGFSTASTVSSVSGRGVGMDVVKKAIEELRGGIEVSSRPGEGTTFTLKLPLTLAIIDGLLVKIGGDHFVFPLSSVEECIELGRKEAQKARGRNLVRVRGEILPYVRLREQFDIRGDRPELEQIVLTETDGQRVGFVVDEVVGEHQTVIKALGRMYREVRGVSGATILGDGSVALILDLPQLVQLEEAAACQGWE